MDQIKNQTIRTSDQLFDKLIIMAPPDKVATHKSGSYMLKILLFCNSVGSKSIQAGSAPPQQPMGSGATRDHDAYAHSVHTAPKPTQTHQIHQILLGPHQIVTFQVTI